MNLRLLLVLGSFLALAGCIVPPTRYELASSARNEGVPEHACCLHFGARETSRERGWGAVERPEPSAPPIPARCTESRPAPAATRDTLELAGGAPRPSRALAESEPAVREPAQEVTGLAAELQRARQALETAQLALDEERRASAGLRRKVEALEADVARRSDETQVLAARLVQAQIRRLEAEKLLLGHQLEAERAAGRR